MRYGLFLVLSFVVTASTFAAREINFDPHKTVEVVIGVGEANRIEVKGGEIMEVIGNESKYGLYWSSNWQNLFIVPKIAAGELIDVSLILGGGRVQDMRFTAGDVPSQTISINIDDIDKVLDRHAKEVELLLAAMAENARGKYYVAPLKRVIDEDKLLVIKQLQAWRYRDLSGAVLEVRNRQNKQVTLKTEEFSRLFKEVIAVRIDKPLLGQREVAKVFVITGNNNWFNHSGFGDSYDS